MMAVANQLIRDVTVIHISGLKHFEQLEKSLPIDKKYRLLPFVSNGMSQLLGAADVVVTRAGATTMLELAALKKAAIVIPNAMLTGGHQVKNAKVYEKESAVIVLDELQFEAQPAILKDAIMMIIKNTALRDTLGKRLGAFAKPHAARDTAQLILQAAKKAA